MTMRKGDYLRSRDLIINDKVTTPKPKYISEVIQQNQLDWIHSDKYDPNEIMIIGAGTGTGKSTFAREIASHFTDDILYLVSRKALKRDVKKLISEAECGNNVSVCTYQEIEEDIRKGKLQYYELFSLFGGLIIADEFHYFTQDSDFNPYTILSYNLIKELPVKKIFLSGTGYGMTYFRLNHDFKVKHRISLPSNYNHIQNTYFYFKNHPAAKNKTNFALERIHKILNENQDDKILYFVDSMKTMETLYADEEIKAHADFYFSSTQCKNKEYKRMLTENPFTEDSNGNQTFKKRILITTNVLDVGVDLKDRNLKHIFIENHDLTTVVQCIGRKRPIDDQDSCDLYLKLPSKSMLQYEKNCIDKAVKKASYEKRLLNNELSQDDPDYQDFLENYAWDESLKKYNCMYFDIIFNNGNATFNELKYSRLLEKQVFLNSIVKEGYIKTFQKVVKITTNIYIISEENNFETDEESLKAFIENNIEKQLLEEQQEELARLCNIPDSRKKTYIRQPKRIGEFLRPYGVRLENVRNRPYWIMHSA